MTDYAEHLIIPRPRTRIIDRLIDRVNALVPYIIAILTGAALGIGQGALQSNSYWTEKIVERSHMDPSGLALPVYEDHLGNVYYSRCERRKP